MTDLTLNIKNYIDNYLCYNCDNDTEHYNIMFHTERYIQTIIQIDKIITQYNSKDILIIGGDNFIDWCMTDLGIFSKTRVQYSSFDIRNQFPIDDQNFDLIINTEVIEHIKDNIVSNRDQFEYRGLRNFFNESYRVLTSKGILFTTTPNANSYISILRLLHKKNSMLWLGHVREYTPDELKYFLKISGFKIDEIKTMQLYNSSMDDIMGIETQMTVDYINMLPNLKQFMYEYNFSTEHREDSIFIIASKDETLPINNISYGELLNTMGNNYNN